MKSLYVVACTVALAIPAHAADKYVPGSGNWNAITWQDGGAPTTPPTAGDTANIGNGFDVSLIGSGTAAQLRIGSTTGGFSATGTLTLTASSGTLNTAANGSNAIQVGSSADSTGVLKVSGGLLRTTGVGGWLSVGFGANSEGTVLLTGGTIAVNNNVALGASGSVGGSTGNMTVSGGLITTGTSFFVGRVVNGLANVGNYVQTGGTNTISQDLRIGNATAATQTTIGTFLISGGNLSVGGNITVGPTGAGAGSGQMTVGSATNITGGGNTVFRITGAGELVFELGADDTFNPIDLTSSAAANVLSLDAGSVITIDGSNLVFSENYDPINLMTYTAGRGPSLLSQGNVSIVFTGFDPQFGTPEVEWTSTSLQLTVVPEPATAALLLGGVAIGLMTARRDRRRGDSSR